MRTRHDDTARRGQRPPIGVQARDDPIDIGNIIVAEPIHVWLARLSFRLGGRGRSRALRQRRQGYRERKREQSNSKHISTDPFTSQHIKARGGGIHLTGHTPNQEHDPEKSMFSARPHAIIPRLCINRRTTARIGSRSSTI